MITQDQIDLLNRVLDGEADHSELELFETHCEVNPRLRRELEELRLVGAAVSEISVVDPPAGMTGQIMRAIEQREAASRSESPTISVRISQMLDWIGEVLLPRPQFALAYAAVAGVIVGLGAYGFVFEAQAPQTDAVFGTMGLAGAVIDEQAIDYQDVHAVAALSETNGALIVDLDVAADSPFDVRLTLPTGSPGWLKLEAGSVGSLLQEIAIEGRTMILTGLEAGRYRAVAGSTEYVTGDVVMSFWRDGIALKHLQLASSPR